MSILVDQNTRLIIQGITGNEGQFHGGQMIAYGTNVVGGVVPGRGGERSLDQPVFNTVAEAVAATGANATVVYVPAAFAADAALEAVDAGLPLVVIITEGIPTLDMMAVYWEARHRGTVVIGPNCPGVISPGKAKVGIMPAASFKPGCVGVVSRSGTLTYEVASQTAEFGQSTVVGIGGDPVIGTSFIDCLTMFNADPETKAIVVVGEIGGTDEEKAAEFVRANVKKPVLGFIAGQTAPPGKRMGHAGAIISGGSGTAPEKVKAFEAAGITVVYEPGEIGPKLKARL
jgi:succinyl-CoA synthetase alpha subunit